MSFLKRWFGWGWGGWGSDQDDGHVRNTPHPDYQQQYHRQQQRQQQQRRRPGAHQQRSEVPLDRRREQPLLQDAQTDNCGGGVQGLDWYQSALLKDEDGDVAHAFLTEPPCQKDGFSPDHKRPRPQLQGSPGKLKPAGPSDVLLDRGNVYVVPHEEHA